MRVVNVNVCEFVVVMMVCVHVCYAGVSWWCVRACLCEVVVVVGWVC